MVNLIFPEPNKNSSIKNKDGIYTILEYCKQNKLQEAINHSNVYRIYVDCGYNLCVEINLHKQLLQAVATTNSFELFQFIHNKLYDYYKYYCLEGIISNNDQITNYIKNYLSIHRESFVDDLVYLNV